MPKFIKGLLIVLVATGLATLTLVLTDLALGGKGLPAAALVGAIFGFLYGLEAGILLIYDLSTPQGWLLLALDMTWSLPNTLFGLVVGNLVYPYFGGPSRNQSESRVGSSTCRETHPGPASATPSCRRSARSISEGRVPTREFTCCRRAFSGRCICLSSP